MQRREILEVGLLSDRFGIFQVDRFDTQEGEVPLRLLRGTDLAGHNVPGAKTEPANLRRADVDVIRAGNVVVLG